MSSTETPSPTKSVVCAEDLQKIIQGRENNDQNISIKRTKPTGIDLFTSILNFDDSSEQHSMASLLQNMNYIKSNINLNINDCYDKPLKAAKLKESIQQALIWILLYYRKLTKNQNSVAYLESMSDLLAMYIDMELRASKRPTEQLSEITTRIISCLYLYLEKSTEHILDTLIKVRNMTSQFHFILDPVMKKILENNGTENRERPKTETMYVRYLLAFRLWREINKDKAVKKEILKTAVYFLGSPPSHLPEFLTKYIPLNESGLRTVTTNLFMKEKSFDVKASCADFINSSKKNTENLHQQQMLGDSVAEKSSSIIKNSSLVSDKVVDLEANNSLIKTNTLNKSNLLENLSRISINDSSNISSNQSLKTPRPLVRRKVKKTNDIIIIDITDEESTPKITRKKMQKKLPWLEEIKKRNSLGLNPEKKEETGISGLKVISPVQNILKSLILVTEDSDQKKIETELYSSLDSWIDFDHLQPASDIYTFFGDELDERSNLSPNVNSKNTSFTELSSTISSPNTSESVLNISSARLNSYDSDSAMEITSEDLSNDIAETESVIKDATEISQVPRFDISKTDCQTEADSIISDSNEHLHEILETRILETNSGHHETSTVSSFEQQIEESRDDYSKALDYSLRKDKTILPPTLTNFESSYTERNLETERNLYTIHESQFQENIENLSLLASVSQQVAAQKGSSPPSKTIKIKEYARLRHPSNNEAGPKMLYQVPDNPAPDLHNRIVNIYPEDFDKVALQVEVTSTSDGLMENFPQSRETTNAILSGETVVLMQKSPNSNIYVINKATENKNNDDETFDDAEKVELFQESESLSRGIIVKTELEEKKLRASLEERKSSSIDVSKSSMDKRKNSNLSCRPNVKQEYSVSSQCTCGITGCSVMHSLSHDLATPQIPLHIPTTYSTPSINLPPLYGNFSSNSELCVPYNKHSHTNEKSCGRSHCSTCLTCTYEMVAHCHQCIHSTSEPHSSYFIPQTTAVQELERTKGESMVGNLYEDQLCKIEKNLLENKQLEELDVKFNQEMKYQVEINNKLPLKKRLTAYSSTHKSYDLPIKTEKSGCYPGTPMLSIANLEVQNNSDVINLPEIGATVELTTAKEDSPVKNRHHSGNVIRRDYRKELEKIRANKEQRRLADSQLSNVPIYHDPLYQRPIKTSLSRKEVEVSSLKRLAVVPSLVEQPQKKAKKSSTRQTRSSQRNVPKVNYNYTEVDPEWNPSGDMKRKRKKTSR